MGMGNYLTMTRDLTWLMPERFPDRPPDLIVDRNGKQRTLRTNVVGLQRCQLTLTADDLLMFVHAGDCGYEFECDACGRVQCVGCDEQVVIDLDEDRVTCVTCNNRDIWAEIRYRYGEGRRRLGLAQAPPEC